MRVGILQFNPHLGEPERNRARADALLAEAGLNGPRNSITTPSSQSNGSVEHDVRSEAADDAQKLDLLVLPEMAFSGYNFADLASIKPFLEPTAAGASTKWAARIARRLQCLVAVGYPETTSTPEKIPSRVNVDEAVSTDVASQSLDESRDAARQNFNSLVIVDPEGKVVAHYRKTHLYYTDATWAEPSPEGFISTSLPFSLSLRSPHMPESTDLSPLPSKPSTPSSSTTTASFAICMDLNPQYFTAPWTAYEAAVAAQSANAALLVASMAWITSGASLEPANEPEWDTLAYWLERLRPLLDTPEDGDENSETLVIVANRTGIEPGPCRAFELDPVVRAAKQVQREEQRQALDAELRAAHNEEEVAVAAGSEPLVVDPPVLAAEGNLFDKDEEEKGRVFMDEVRYAGSSAVMALGGGRASVWEVLGRAEEKVLVVDTSRPPKQVWRLGRKGAQSSSSEDDGRGSGSGGDSQNGDVNGGGSID